MKASEIMAGKTYRAKKPTKVDGEFNDRTVVWINSDRTKVQYNGPAVAWGRRLPTVPMEKFLAWAESVVYAHTENGGAGE